ncbi:WHG domain-containing protein [Deinococcus pimensis]|uniref:WHG domain-containing protein n=1 Tax=Deinococcus pimensis TaxID=309888 RepID=UPI0004AE75CC|nr:WHG domain-containing protein [Deinococcus pimensis]
MKNDQNPTPERNPPRSERAMDVREVGRAASRDAVLSLAAELLVERGELPLRLLAQRAGASTTMIYTLFGGKDGLAEALFMQGADTFHRALRDAAGHEPDPYARVLTLCRTYRELALAYPAHYGVIFRNIIPGYTPSEDAYRGTLRLFGPITEAVLAGMQGGRLRSADPGPLVMELWLATHGLVSAEVARFLPPGTDAAAMLDRLVRDLLRAHHPDA